MLLSAFGLSFISKRFRADCGAQKWKKNTIEMLLIRLDYFINSEGEQMHKFLQQDAV
jgi:hypothetical protein